MTHIIDKNTGFHTAIARAPVRKSARRMVSLAMVLWLAVCVIFVALAWIDPAGVL